MSDGNELTWGRKPKPLSHCMGWLSLGGIPKFLPLFKDPEGNEYLRLPILPEVAYRRAGGGLDRIRRRSSHTTTTTLVTMRKTISTRQDGHTTKGAGADEAGSSLPPSLFVPTWGIHQRSRVTTPEECRDLMVNHIPPGAHALRQFESLYDTHHALQESLETTRSHLVRTREDFNVVQNFYNTLSERHRKLREEHAQCF
ncbi:hypothetical protein Tco_0696544 [Tanacetum coccineum]